jgi:mRNA-degrading endonuclease RelE of RelBE toxin-antitoxin system
VRQGDDRVVYAVDDDEGIVEIVKIGQRREVYRN